MNGFIITTHYNNYELIHKCLTLLIQNIPTKNFVVLYVNETTCNKVKNIRSEFNSIEVIFIDNQTINNGLTGTWNSGIKLCIENNCNVITILGHDTFVNNSINSILDKAKNAQINKKFEYFAPLYYNYSGKNSELWQDSLHYKNNPLKFLIGSFLTIPVYTLDKMKNRFSYYFNEKRYPFGYNDIHFYKTCIQNGGKGIIDYDCIINHEYKRTWAHIKSTSCTILQKPEKEEPIQVSCFNWMNYLRKNPDLKNIKTENAAYKHYMTYGKFQNRHY